MNKRIDIRLIDPKLPNLPNDYDRIPVQIIRPRLYSDEICNIINKLDDRRVSNDEMLNALDVITMYLYQNELYNLGLYIDNRNKELDPYKEMTLEEIEKELGYKVKIVNKKGE